MTTTKLQKYFNCSFFEELNPGEYFSVEGDEYSKVDKNTAVKNDNLYYYDYREKSLSPLKNTSEENKLKVLNELCIDIENTIPRTSFCNFVLLFGIDLNNFKWYRRMLGGEWERWVIEEVTGLIWFQVRKWTTEANGRPAGTCRGTPLREEYLYCKVCGKNYELNIETQNHALCNKCLTIHLEDINKDKSN